MWPQFRLWHAFVAVALCAITCAVLWWWRDGFVRQDQARRYFEERNGSFTVVRAEPGWPEVLVGPSLYYVVTQADLGRYVGPIDRLAYCTAATTVVAPRDCTDNDLSVLSHIPRLSYLSIHSSRLSGNALQAIEGRTELTDLHLDSSNLHEEAIRTIGTLSGLKTLDLSYTNVADEQLVHLAGLMHLDFVAMVGTRLRGAGFTALAASPIRALILSDSDVDGSIIDTLNAMPRLEVIALDGTRVETADILRLRAPNLHEIYVSGDDAVSAQLRTAFPAAHVEVSKPRRKAIE